MGNHDFSSQEMAGYCGSVVIDITNAKVDLSNPDFTLYVEIRENKTYMFTEKIPGLGGLPVGSQGSVVCLISSGIDSPVASFQMLKRGCKIILLHCDNNPYTKNTIEKVKKQAQRLQRYSVGVKVKLYTINFGQYLEHVIKQAPPRMTCVLCKSGMYQTAAQLAKFNHANAIADGSSIGQVASQTLESMSVVNAVTNMPIIRPVVTYDKEEIVSVARKIKTYDTSIRPYEDCCTVFVPEHPVIKPKLEDVLVEEEKCDLEESIKKAIENTKTITLNCFEKYSVFNSDSNSSEFDI